MSYNLIFVDVGLGDRFPTTLHRMNVITGDYLMPIYLRNVFINQIEDLASIILRDRPDKIIFDKFGGGFVFYENFMKRLKYEPYDKKIHIDAFGLITYLEDYK